MAYSSGEYEMALPVELIEKVCFYLEVEDLLNLSASNIFWRNAVNQNCIWKRLCVEYFFANPSEKPIIDRKCLVKPAFEIVTNSSPNLNDICSWRIRYAQEIHVINNWIQQKYHAEEPDILRQDNDNDIPDEFSLSGSIFGNSLVFTYHEGDTPKYGIRDLNNDTIAHYNQVDLLYYFRNGFLVYYKNIISYYAIKEDVFELKIRTVVTKALHPEIPLLADISSLQNYEKNDCFYSWACNERYLIFQCEMKHCTIIVWDFKNLNTFSFDLSFFCSSIVTKDYILMVGEGESSILALGYRPTISTYHHFFILNIKNTTIILVHETLIRYFRFPRIFVDGSLALVAKKQIQFLQCNGMTTEVLDCYNVIDIINCRSFYCARRHIRDTEVAEVILIDKKSFSVQVINELGYITFIDCYLRCTVLDFVLVVDIKSQKTELINLKKLKIIKCDDHFKTLRLKSNKIIMFKRKILHFW